MFKNSVGRPSNDFIRRKKIFYSIIVLLGIFVIGVGFYCIKNLKNSGIHSVDLNASVNNNNNNVVIIIGASQVTRMKWWLTEYKSPTGKKYNVNNNLVIINESGTGFDYQTSLGWYNQSKNLKNGWQRAMEFIKSKSGGKSKNYHIFFPMAGNDIKKFTCGNNGNISNNNVNINNYAKNYSNRIKELKDSGYKVQGYVVSSHPVVVSEKKDNNDKIVYNDNKFSCIENYRSNFKYYKFNQAMQYIVNNKSYQLNGKQIYYKQNLRYLPLLIKIMNVNENGSRFSFKSNWKDYSTTDGIHWNQETTLKYVKLMLDTAGNL